MGNKPSKPGRQRAYFMAPPTQGQKVPQDRPISPGAKGAGVKSRRNRYRFNRFGGDGPRRRPRQNSSINPFRKLALELHANQLVFGARPPAAPARRHWPDHRREPRPKPSVLDGGRSPCGGFSTWPGHASRPCQGQVAELSPARHAQPVGKRIADRRANRA